MNERYLYIIEQLHNIGINNGKTVDCGCGEGFGSKFLYKAGYEIYPFDISKKNVEICREKGVNALFGDIRKLPLRENFSDIFVCSETLEHLTRNDSLRATKEIIRISKVGGYICVTVPQSKEICLRGKEHKQFLSKEDLLNHFENQRIIFEGVFCKNSKKCNLVLIFQKCNG